MYDKDLKTEVAQQCASILESKGFEKIKTNAEGFEKPKGFANKNSGEKVIPDITAVKNGSKNYFEIINRKNKEKIDEIKSKWLFLSTLAGHKGGKLYLIVTNGHMSYTTKILKQIPVEPEILKVGY